MARKSNKMNIWFVRLLPILLPWKHHKYILNGKYVESIVLHVVKRYPLGVTLIASNDN